MQTETQCYQPSDGTWSDCASLAGLQSVLDPRDLHGLKNSYIDRLHRLAIASSRVLRRDSVVLDYGCGTGRITRFLASRVRRVIGVDITPEMIEAAQRESCSGNVSYHVMEPSTLPLDDASVDVIVSVYVLQYVALYPNRYRELLAEFLRVLRPGGRMVFVEQASPNGQKSGSLQGAVSVEDYLNIGMEMKIHFSTPEIIRLGAPKKWERKTALNPRFPEILRGFAVQRTLRRNTRLDPSDIADQPYVDYRIVGAVAQDIDR